jgi:hypothetical protein
MYCIARVSSFQISCLRRNKFVISHVRQCKRHVAARHGGLHESAEAHAEDGERAEHRPAAPALGVRPVALRRPGARPRHLASRARRARGVAQAGGLGLPRVPVPPRQPVPVHGDGHSELHRTVRPRSRVVRPTHNRARVASNPRRTDPP